MSNLNFSIRMTLVSFSHVTFTNVLSDPAFAYFSPGSKVSFESSLLVGMTIPSTGKIVLCRTPQLFG